MSIGHISKAKFALGELNASLAATEKQRPELKAASAFVSLTGAALLHLPLPDKMPEVESILPIYAYAIYKDGYGAIASDNDVSISNSTVHAKTNSIYGDVTIWAGNDATGDSGDIIISETAR